MDDLSERRHERPESASQHTRLHMLLCVTLSEKSEQNHGLQIVFAVLVHMHALSKCHVGST